MCVCVLSVVQLLQFLYEESLHRGVTIVYATHIFDGMQAWATHVAHMASGKMVTFGQVDQFIEAQQQQQHSAKDTQVRRVDSFVCGGCPSLPIYVCVCGAECCGQVSCRRRLIVAAALVDQSPGAAHLTVDQVMYVCMCGMSICPASHTYMRRCVCVCVCV